ncbi:hypothetical protein [Nostoc punctiforme]|uniref:Uncharacterized protein n=1 Tax=Nostoc punctiforme (strain ATCC 29133 / PCC 73102) TaxID=63737 RepID=B2J5P7_NOSP7|nr:hypothetical protein [Nostoc punctiforme]ACC83779.1 hypothetical protein Npun_R5472 [Nostoc punctiforme PCC 73102]
MKNNAPFSTSNPQDFKLRIVWSVDTVSKMVAELSNCKWLPRIGETLILPIDETRKPSSWRKFKVFDIVYDFQNQTTKVLCSPIKSSTLPDAKTLIQKLEERNDKWEVWEKAFAASETTAKSEALERQAHLAQELSQMDEEDIDEELERLRRKVLD